MEHPGSELEQLSDIEVYRQKFMDARLWAPYVRQVCRRLGLAPCQQVRAGLAGTYPTFIVEDRWVVKLFGRLFDGGQSFAAERWANDLVRGVKGIPAPGLLGSGRLFDNGDEGWHWPFMVWEYIDGATYGESAGQLSHADKAGVAFEMGQMLRRLHSIEIPTGCLFKPGAGGWRGYLDFLEERRQGCADHLRQAGSLPGHLIDQIDDYLPPVEDLVDPGSPPHLVHADLTGDHLLGRLGAGGWQTKALIDFGDAFVGTLYYELGALFFDLFQADYSLLDTFLRAYGLSAAQRACLPRKALSTALLHRFNLFGRCFETAPPVRSLEELEQRLYTAV